MWLPSEHAFGGWSAGEFGLLTEADGRSKRFNETNLYGVITKDCGRKHWILETDRRPVRAYRWTQVEVTAAAGPAVTMGFNPGELADFIVGWFGIDLYGDDIRWACEHSALH